MKSKVATSQSDRIRELLALAKRCSAEPQVQAALAQFACVVCAGAIEVIFRDLLTERCKNTSSPDVAEFASSCLEMVQNPKSKRLVEVIAAFNTKWSRKLEKHLDEDGRRDAIDSIMNNRHLLAHGKQTAISLARIEQYWERALNVLEFVESLTK